MCGDGNNYDGRNDNAYRYFDDLYVDTTHARVMLCSTSSYPTSNTEICEPQIPTAWSTAFITVRINLGALKDSTAYLFVFDGNNNHNLNGFPVTIIAKGNPSDESAVR